MVEWFNDLFATLSVQFPVVFDALNRGFLQTLELFGITLVGSLPLGLLISFGTMSKFKPLSSVMKTIVWIVRGSPLMLQLFIVFYCFPWEGNAVGRFWAAAVAFIVNYSCYFAEIYRGGIQGVPVGQQEAGLVLGLSRRQIFFKVTLLQMIKRIVPPMSNEIITLVKDTSLAQVIGFQELIYMGQKFMKTGVADVKGIIWPLFFTAVYYLLFSGILTILLNKLEKKLSYFKV